MSSGLTESVTVWFVSNNRVAYNEIGSVLHIFLHVSCISLNSNGLPVTNEHDTTFFVLFVTIPTAILVLSKGSIPVDAPLNYWT